MVCNIAQTADAPAVIDCGSKVLACCVPVLFETSTVEPTVAEQVAALSAIADILGDKVLVIRTADIGADKPVLDAPGQRG